jgi:hypothetical protein
MFSARVSRPAASLLLALAVSGRVNAQTSNKALAEALFQSGRDLLENGRTSEACEKFAASQRVEAKLGTLLNLAACHEAQGRTASAWAEFTEAVTQAARANQPDRERFAREHVVDLDKRLSRVELLAPSGKIAVAIDGAPLDPGVVGTAFPMDPGTHVLSVSARGKRTWTQSITVPVGPGTQRVGIPPLEDASSAPSEAPAQAADSGSGVPPPVDPSPSRRTMGWAAVGVGAVGAAMGTFFGIRAFSLKADAQHECEGAACSQRGLDLLSEARVAANVSTVAMLAAAVALGVGVYLVLTSPASGAPSGASR